MSKLKELLKGLKMELFSLGEIAGFLNGKGHEKAISDDGKYIVVNSKFVSSEGKIIKYSDVQIVPLYIDDILIVMSDLPNGKALAKTFLVEHNDRYTLNQRIGCISVKNKNALLPKYLNYILNRSSELLKYNNGLDQTNLKKNQILEVSIPIPCPDNPEKSLEIQKEIVRILDELTETTNKLKNELEKDRQIRKRQFEFFRTAYLNNQENEIQWLNLGKLGKFTYGLAASASDFGNTRFVRISDINAKGKLIKDDIKYVNLSDENKKYLLKKNDLLMARTGATFGKTMIFDEDYDAIYAGFLIKLDLDKNSILPKYYWHFAQSELFWGQANKLVNGGGQPQFNANTLKNVQLPIPFFNNPKKSLAEQERIVKLLDIFDATYTAIEEEITKEIKLRTQQYEYYREKLLTFPEN